VSLASGALADFPARVSGNHWTGRRGRREPVRIANAVVSTSASELPSLLQERLGLVARLRAVLLSALWLGGLASTIWLDNAREFRPILVLGLVAIGLSGSCGVLLARKQLGLGALKVFDVAIPVVLATSVSVTIGISTLAHTAVFGSLLWLMMLLTVRAALVPSPASRTALIGAAATLPLVFTAYHSARLDPALPRFFSPLGFAAGAAVWSVLLTIATTVTSRVIYGLERDVRRARQLGQYTLLEKLGQGGMGSVYLAEHAMLRRRTAIKLLLPERALAANLTRFEREAQLTSLLTHPNIVSIYDYGRTADGVFYYAMEYVDGVSLQTLVEDYGPQPAARVIHILRQLACALDEAHRAGLIHRDVKPANVLISDPGNATDRVKVLDFGLVKSTDSEGVAVTQSSSITGTPAYMAPEMILSPTEVDARVDIYGLGAVGYYLLTAKTVFEGSSMLELCSHHIHTRPTPPSERGVELPPELDALILACLAKTPEQRPSSAVEALSAMSRAHPWTTAQAAAFWQRFRGASPRPAQAR
jgi:eukaryotic-like serine/threonine-protein kinase